MRRINIRFLDPKSKCWYEKERYNFNLHEESYVV